MKAKTEFIVGVGLRADGSAIHPSFLPTLMKRSQDAILAEYGGVTITRGQGLWEDETGGIFEEPVSTFTIYHSPKSYEAARKRGTRVARELAVIWDQETVMVAVTRVGDIWFEGSED